MATISTAIELYDSFTAPLMNVINAVSAGVSAMENLQATMSEPVTMSVADTVTDQINQAMTAINAAREAMSEPLTPETTTATWNNPTMPVFTDSGCSATRFLRNSDRIIEKK